MAGSIPTPDVFPSTEANYQVAFDRATIGCVFTLPNGHLVRVNETFCDMLGYTRAELQSMRFASVTHPDDLAISMESVRCLLAGERETFEMEKRYLHHDGHPVHARVSTTLVRDAQGNPSYFVTHIVDNSGDKRALAELEGYRTNLEEMVRIRTNELVRTQEAVTRQAREIIELSAPVLQVWEGILVVPLVGVLDSERSRNVTERLLQGIVDYHAEVVLLDITGVPLVDTCTAQHLLETAKAVKLLGAEVVLTGIRSAIAQTLVHLGVNLSNLVTRATLSAGLAYAFERRNVRLLTTEA